MDSQRLLIQASDLTRHALRITRLSHPLSEGVAYHANALIVSTRHASVSVRRERGSPAEPEDAEKQAREDDLASQHEERQGWNHDTHRAAVV